MYVYALKPKVELLSLNIIKIKTENMMRRTYFLFLILSYKGLSSLLVVPLNSGHHLISDCSRRSTSYSTLGKINSSAVLETSRVQISNNCD